MTRFQLRLAPNFLFYLPVLFAVAIVVCLSIMYAPQTWSFGMLFAGKTSATPGEIQGGWFLTGVIGWTIGLGGLGSIVFLYVNALSISIDRTVDVSDRGFVLMGIIIGCLFGFVLGLPTILSAAFAAAGDPPIEWIHRIAGPQDATVLISPFVYGFSTPLVIAVLNRMIETIQGFLGMVPPRQNAGRSAAPAAPQAPRSGETGAPTG